MDIVCLDLEGVLVPEIWIAFAQKTGIPELKITTREEPDYNKLMKYRIGILEREGYTLKDIQDVIASLRPLEGAQEFVGKIREKAQLVILSDTFVEFASPLMKQLGWPTILCNSLIVNEKNMLTGFKLRIPDGKRCAIEAFRSISLRTIAAGDSYNDLSMIRSADKGFLFCPPQQIVDDNPDIKVAYEHDELFKLISAELK